MAAPMMQVLLHPSGSQEKIPEGTLLRDEALFKA